MCDSLHQPVLCRRGLATKYHHWWKTNVRQPLPGFHGYPIRPAARLCRACVTLCQSISGRFNLLRALGGTTWGWHTSDSRQVYIAIVRRILEYSAAVLAPWLSATSTSKLVNVQLEAAGAITGLVRSTPAEAVLEESQLPPISSRFQAIYLLSADEWAHFSPADDRRQTIFTAFRQHIWRNDWRSTQFLCLNQHGLIPQLLTQTPLSCEQLFIPSWSMPPPIPTVMTPAEKRLSPSM